MCTSRRDGGVHGSSSLSGEGRAVAKSRRGAVRRQNGEPCLVEGVSRSGGIERRGGYAKWRRGMVRVICGAEAGADGAVSSWEESAALFVVEEGFGEGTCWKIRVKKEVNGRGCGCGDGHRVAG
ncbi:uncharacterized protein A4U43_C08F12040 [Asparagus officinalis]|nr:uncharacterized protein A4U43_C08F12040 [Asparagus officinalis]